MKSYLKWNEQTIYDFSDANINSLYREGYLFTRLGKGIMNQTRSLRIDLNKFKLSSENRRVLRKIADCRLRITELPYEKYDWTIGKMGKDFYAAKFGEGTFSANKIKELLTTEHNFNRLLKFIPNGVRNPSKLTPEEPQKTNVSPSTLSSKDSSFASLSRNEPVAYAICHETDELLHYSYPFYQISDLGSRISDLGMGMMLKAILYAQENGKKYIYLGSAQRPADTYKLQFEGLEWFDGSVWKDDLEELKQQIKQIKQ